MSEGIRTAVRYCEETTPGTTPTNPVFKPLRITRSALEFRPITVESEELVASRNTRDIPRVGIEAGGSLNFEQVFDNLFDLHEGLFHSRWVLMPIRYNATADDTITDINATTGVITVVATAGTKKNSGAFAVGQLVRSTGETNAGNNFLKRVTAASATSLTVSTTGLVTAAAPAAGYRLKVVGIEAPAAGNIAVTVAGLGSGEVAAVTFTGVDALACGIVPGMWFKMSGLTGSSGIDNGWYKALNVVAGRVGCSVAPAGVVTDTASGVQARLWLPDYIRNGTTKIAYSLEQDYQDLTAEEWDVLVGQRVGKLDLEMNARAILRSQITFVGQNASNATSRTSGATTATADEQGALPRTGDILNTSSHVARIGENGAAIGSPNHPLALTLSIDNQLAADAGLGQIGAVGIFAGDFAVSGVVTTFYGSNAVRTKLLNGTASSLDWILSDPSGTRAMIYDVPKVKYTDGNVDGIQKGSRRTLPAAFRGLENTLGFTMQLMRIEEYA